MPLNLSDRPLWLLPLLLITGCASLTTPDFGSELALCQEQLLARPGDGDITRDSSVYRPAEQPYFGISRVNAAFAVDSLDGTAFAEWKTRVVQDSWQELAAHQQRTLGTEMTSSRSCLVALAQTTPQADWAAYADSARDHDLYRDWQRWVGLYPLTSLVVSSRIRSAQADWRRDYGGPFAADGHIYHPATEHQTDPDTVRDWLQQAYDNSPLDLPHLPTEQLQALQQQHAPAFKVLQDSAADQLGSVTAMDGEPSFTTEPAVAYIDHGYTRFEGQWLLQLSYTLWFSERPKGHALDIYGGPWNGITWRVTLDTAGQPLWFDAIHNCGCYHQIWVDERHLARDDIGREEPLFLPFDWQGRPRLTLLPGTHYIRRVVDAEQAPEGAITGQSDYELAAYDTLLTLPDQGSADSVPVSMFRPDGLVAGSERLERLLLWPFGVQSPGAMRRNGTHAIAFVGKRHFDDPDLFEQLLEPVRD